MATRLAEFLAANTKREMVARGWTQAHLAELCDWPPARISEILRGDLNYRLATLETLAKALAVSPASLILPPAEEILEKIPS